MNGVKDGLWCWHLWGNVARPGHTYSLGAFMEPIQQELGGSRGPIAAGLTICSVVGAVLSPFVGMMVDRVGSRRLRSRARFCSIACSSLLVCFTGDMAVVAAVVHNGDFTALRPMVRTSAISRRFDAGRGLAFGVTPSASVASSLAPLFSSVLISKFRLARGLCYHLCALGRHRPPAFGALF